MDVKIKDSLVAGAINGVINAYIANLHFNGMKNVPMSINMIADLEVTVWGEAVSLTFGLGIILSLITSTLFIHQLKKTHPSNIHLLQTAFWRDQLPIALTQAGTLFGWFVTLAVIWTKFAGEVMVSSSTAVILVGIFAFFITLVVEMQTKKSVIYKKVNLLG